MCLIFFLPVASLVTWRTHESSTRKAMEVELYLVSRRLMVNRKQRSDDDVTRYVRYNSPLVGLGRISLSGSRPDRQNQQQTEYHPGPLGSKRGSRSGVCH